MSEADHRARFAERRKAADAARRERVLMYRRSANDAWHIFINAGRNDPELFTLQKCWSLFCVACGLAMTRFGQERHDT